MAGESAYSDKFKVLDVEIDVDEMLAYAEKALGQFKAKAPAAVRTAINNAARKAKKLDEKAAKSAYTDKSDLNNLKLTKATVSNLEAILEDKGENISMTHFKYRVGKRQTSVLINKKHGGYKKLSIGNDDHRGPFVANGTLDHGGSGMMVRIPDKYMTHSKRMEHYKKQNKHTEALRKLYSISSPVQHGNPEIWDIEVAEATEAEIYKELDEQITRIWTRMLKG